MPMMTLIRVTPCHVLLMILSPTNTLVPCLLWFEIPAAQLKLSTNETILNHWIHEISQYAFTVCRTLTRQYSQHPIEVLYQWWHTQINHSSTVWTETQSSKWKKGSYSISGSSTQKIYESPFADFWVVPTGSVKSTVATALLIDVTATDCKITNTMQLVITLLLKLWNTSKWSTQHVEFWWLILHASAHQEMQSQHSLCATKLINTNSNEIYVARPDLNKILIN